MDMTASQDAALFARDAKATAKNQRERKLMYAAKTRIDSNQTRNQIEAMLKKHGAKKIACAFDDEERSVIIAFIIGVSSIKMTLPIPSSKVEMQRWRLLFLVVKAKLEAIEGGITTLEKEFLADVVTRNGATVYERHRVEIDTMLTTGEPPKLMLTA